MKVLFRNILGSDALVRALAGLAASYIRFCWVTTRWQHINREGIDQYAGRQQPVIVTFWHGRMLMLPKMWHTSPPLSVIISDHRDGRIIAGAIASFGLRTIKGSTSKGGMKAFRGALRALKNGEAIAITPDGSRGPRMRVSEGLVQLARLSGAPILPMTYSVSRRIVLRSWDRMIVPLPFARGVMICGELVTVAPDDDIERVRLSIEETMNRLCGQIDAACGVEPQVPAQMNERRVNVGL